jgi:Leucine-rich repeat (LRR) protein
MAGINLILQNNPIIRVINCGSSSPKLGGTINLSDYPVLEEFYCNDNDITAISGYTGISNLGVFQVYNNKLSSPFDMRSLTNLFNFRCDRNNLTQFPNVSGLNQLANFRCHLNQITGTIPSLTGLTNLQLFYCNGNKLTGPFPSLNGLNGLREFYCHQQTGSPRIQGTLGSFNSLTNLQIFNCSNNQISGSIPNLNGLNNLQDFRCTLNLFTGFAGGPVSNKLGNFLVQGNQLRASAVNSILASFVVAGRTAGNANNITPGFETCVLNVGGTNSRPTGQGITDVTTLRNRGWTVTTGTALL